VRDKRPVLVFLMETKIMQNKSNFLRAKLGFDNAFTVDCKGRSGGLILLWNSDIEVKFRTTVGFILMRSSNALQLIQNGNLLASMAIRM
jgi:hypothetical protein